MGELKAFVGADIRISGDQHEIRTLERTLKPFLTFDNPDYWKKVQMGKWAGDTPQSISLIRREGLDLIIPFGMLSWVFSRRNLFSGIVSGFSALRAFDYKSGINLYPYQENAVNAALRARQGVIVAPCGSGKTQIGLELVARIGGKALWITHTSDLLNQSMERAKSVFGCDPSSFGTITAGKMNVGESITFSTVQTLFRVDLDAIRDSFDVVIVDECHHCVGTPTRVTMFSKVLSSLRARYKFGLTATPKRSDGLTPCMYALIGERAYEITQADVESTTCKVEVEFVQTSFKPDMTQIIMPDGTMSFPRFVNQITQDEQRNNQIAGVAASSEFPCLVLTDRVAHVEKLAKLIQRYGGGRTVACLYGAGSKEDRKRYIQKAINGDVQVLIGTFALAREGLDIPALRTLVMATPQKNESVIIQSAGRVARSSEGKKVGKVIDFDDRGFPMLAGWSKKRRALYRRMGFSSDGSF